MADAALARREARRRKILENSLNRLQRISGKNDNEVSKGSTHLDPIIAPISEPIYESFVSQEVSDPTKCGLFNGVIDNGDPFDLLSTSHENFAFGEGDVINPSNDLAAFAPSTVETAQPPPLLEKLVNYKYDIVVLSLLIQLFYSFSLITFSNSYFFLPLVLYITTKLAWCPKQNNSYITNVLLLLHGMSVNRVTKIVSIMQWVNGFSQDVCVFLFTTICIQFLWQIVGNNILEA